MITRLVRVQLTRPLLAALLVLAPLAGCRLTDPDGKPDALLELTRHWNQWQRANITDYRFDYQIAAFAQIPPVRIEVFNRVVTRVTNLQTNTALPNPQSYPNVDSLFTMAARALANDNYDAHITYDETYGFPSVIAASSRIPDTGYIATTNDFAILTLWLTRSSSARSDEK